EPRLDAFHTRARKADVETPSPRDPDHLNPTETDWQTRPDLKTSEVDDPVDLL
ncbi:unnamed protein product, partial [Durusdinium trenchii]